MKQILPVSLVVLSFLLASLLVGAVASDSVRSQEINLTHKVMLFIFQLFVILILAKLAGEFMERVLKQPTVIGEVCVGIIMGPYLLGGKLYIPELGYLFTLPKEGTVSPVPLSPELWSFAQIGVVILLFLAGLETDKRRFFRYAGSGFMVGMGGILLPFLFGAGFYAIWFNKDFLDPVGLFIGAILTATSIGITARVLHDLGKIDSPEGVTILAAAVIDDVLGILTLAIVIGIVEKGAVVPEVIAVTAAKAIGIWIILTGIVMLFSKLISRAFLWFRTEGAAICMGIAVCFLAAVLCELLGLALVIGAYMVGLALSGTELDRHIQGKIRTISNFITPVFFVTVGMLVNFKLMMSFFFFGIIISILAIAGKIFGCGLPALLGGFNFLGASRVGIGMLPRGEIALVIASIGLARNVIDQEIFGIAVMMTFITTLLAPAILVLLFKKSRSGLSLKSI